MSMNVGELYATLGLRTNDFDQGLGRAEGRFRGFGTTAGKLAAGAGVAIAAGIGAGVTKSLQSAVNLDTGLREVFTLLPGISDAARKQMEDDLFAFSKEAGRVPEEVLPALYQALSAGVPPDNVFAFLETANQAAVGGITNLETAVDGVTSVVNAYGSDVVNATQASDLMFTAVRLGKTDFEQLSQSMFQVAPVAASMGVEFGDATAALAALTAKGTPTSVAANQIKGALAELGKEGTKASTAFADVAGKSFPQFIAEGGNLQQALQLLEQAADNNGQSILDMFGSIEAGQAALSLTGDGTQAFTDALAEMDASAGATGKAFDEMDAGIGRSGAKLKAQAAVILAQVGRRLQPLLESFVSFIQDNMPTIERIIDAVFSAIGTAVQALTAVWQTLTDGLRAGVEWWEANIGRLGSSTEGTREWLAEVWAQISTIVGDAVELVRAVIDFFVGWAQGVWERHGERFMEIIESTWDNIKQVVGGALNIIQGIIRTVTAIFQGDWSAAWDGIKQTVGGAVDVILGVIDQAKNGIIVVWTLLTDTLSQLWGGMWTAIKGAADAAWQYIKGVLNFIIGGMNAVLSAWNSIQFEVPKIDIPVVDLPGLPPIGGGSLGGFTIGVPRVPLIPTLHTGGLALDDTPAILQRGEGVIDRAAMNELVQQLRENRNGQTIVLQVGDKEMGRWMLDATGLNRMRQQARMAGA